MVQPLISPFGLMVYGFLFGYAAGTLLFDWIIWRTYLKQNLKNIL